MSGARQALGLHGEALAEQRLRRHGYRLLERRYRSRHGEIDLIMEDGDVVVFVEVKTRSGSGFGGAEAVSPGKIARIVRVAAGYLARRGWFERLARFDVVEILETGGEIQFRHLADAFRPPAGRRRGRR